MDIYDKCKNVNLVKNINEKFDIEFNKLKVYDQDDSFTCWTYAAFNAIKGNISIY